nr:MAG TPA: hypothetical protein [Caudoviricetes sp.]
MPKIKAVRIKRHRILMCAMVPDCGQKKIQPERAGNRDISL